MGVAWSPVRVQHLHSNRGLGCPLPPQEAFPFTLNVHLLSPWLFELTRKFSLALFTPLRARGATNESVPMSLTRTGACEFPLPKEGSAGTWGGVMEGSRSAYMFQHLVSSQGPFCVSAL